MSNIQDINNPPELRPPFEQLKEIDADGKEWWNSRKLARVMGYGEYWNFERVIAKTQAWTLQKGYHLSEHFVERTKIADWSALLRRAMNLNNLRHIKYFTNSSYSNSVI